MKTIPPILFALAMQGTSISSPEQIVTLGDSLTYAYESEFGFQQFVTGFGLVGDGMPNTVRNWAEILNNPLYGEDRFQLGIRDDLTVDPPFDPPFNFYFRQSHNWSVPGLKIDELRRFITGDPTATFSNFVADSSTLGTLFSYSNFNDSTDFALTDLQNQIQNTAERLTLFIGGNDVKDVYGTIYNGGSAGTFVADFVADTVAILDRVQTLNPNIQIVLVNVPHIGITLDVQQDFPYNPVNTERVSAVLRDLNGQLANLALGRKIGYADIYDATLQMLNGTTKFTIHTVTFITDNGTEDGDLGQVWLNGPISDNFHPNTNGQAVIANEIIHAFNRRYKTGIPLLTATEILDNLLARPASEIDRTYAQWIQRYYPTFRPASDDSDGDGIPAGTEFALGLSPLRRDADRITSGVVGGFLEIAYPSRLPGSLRYSLTPESSSTLLSPFTPFGTLPTIEADGLFHARLPVGSSPRFLRLKAVIP